MSAEFLLLHCRIWVDFGFHKAVELFLIWNHRLNPILVHWRLLGTIWSYHLSLEGEGLTCCQNLAKERMYHQRNHHWQKNKSNPDIKSGTEMKNPSCMGVVEKYTDIKPFFFSFFHTLSLTFAADWVYHQHNLLSNTKAIGDLIFS